MSFDDDGRLGGGLFVGIVDRDGEAVLEVWFSVFVLPSLGLKEVKPGTSGSGMLPFVSIGRVRHLTEPFSTGLGGLAIVICSSGS